MDTDCLSEESTITLDGQPKACLVIPHAGSSPHAFFMDCTHDNESPQSKRTAEDALSTGSLVTFSRSAIGSNRGFDDLYPKLLDVVTEERHYEVYKDSTESGIGGMKRLLNHIHTELVLEGAVEGHFSQEGEVSILLYFPFRSLLLIRCDSFSSTLLLIVSILSPTKVTCLLLAPPFHWAVLPQAQVRRVPFYPWDYANMPVL